MENEIKAAVDWWADILMKPPHHDNGDKSPGGAVTQILSAWVSADLTEPTEIQIRTFSLQLELMLKMQLAAGKKHLHLGCDYDPCCELVDAAAHACMDRISTRFPWKTNMWIKEGEVSVSLGYGAPSEVIYPA